MRRLGVLTTVLVALIGGLLTALPADAATVSAKSLLSRLRVAPESGTATYARSDFRQWVDADHDSCNTREEVLISESRVKVQRDAGCTIAKGRWVSWYDGRTWTRPSDVDIDDMVPLKEAWESGGRAWATTTRTAFANDLGFTSTLNAVTDNVNSSKQDRDPAEWLPRLARCRYATAWVGVKYRWHLTIDGRERRALSSLLTGACGAKRLTAPKRAVVSTTKPTPPIVPEPRPTPAPPATPAPQPTYAGVTPGAFCADHLAYGYTSSGTLMRCTTTATDTRYRWRAA